MKRTQIYLDESQARRLARRAEASGVTASHLVREAVEAYLSGSHDESTELDRQRRALEEAFGSIPRLPEGAMYVERVRRADAARERELEERWRSR